MKEERDLLENAYDGFEAGVFQRRFSDVWNGPVYSGSLNGRSSISYWKVPEGIQTCESAFG